MSTDTNTLEEFSHFFEVRLDLFDGPIDLLLHLVKLRELPIEKISLASVADQYLKCIESVERFDLEIAGEYLVIAATLLSIKSSVLLGEPATFVHDADGNLIDAHEELLRRLRDAEIYKDGAYRLSTRALLGVDVFSNYTLLDEVEAPEPGFKNHDPFLLGKAFRKLLENAKEAPTLQISFDPVSIVERMLGVLEALQKNGGSLIFHKLVPDLTNRGSIISTFVALLELCKRQAISVFQELGVEEIIISLAASDGAKIELGSLTSEFDAPLAQDKAAALGNG